MIPALINFLTKSHLVEKYDLSSLRSIQSGAGPLDQKTADAVKRRFPHIKYVFQGNLTFIKLTRNDPQFTRSVVEV
jgi:non-ribosomal peptide synthetase component E (peptide arylation enzyme)